MNRRLNIATLLLTTALVSACTMVPHYDRPASPVAGAWRLGGETGAGAKTAAETGWHSFFVAPQLQHLIEKGLQNNRDLRQAMLNVEVARAQYRIQRSELLPSVDAGASLTRQRIPETVSATGRAQSVTQYEANLGVTAFELDIFGRLRSLNQEALESYFATAEARNAAQISLIAEIANAYLTYLADREQLSLSQQTLDSQQKSYDLSSARFKAGVGTKLELRQIETLLETARVDFISNTRLIEQSRNALELLVGSPLTDDELAGNFKDAPLFVTDIAPGLPSDLLTNRPDIRAAEHQLKAANADIGAARAAFFPTITLTASGGTAGEELSQLFSSGSGAWSFVPRVTLPIFTAGRNKANLDVSSLRRDINVANYEKTIQTAFREVSDALVARETYGDELAAQRKLVAATQDAYNLADARYRRGIDDYLAVLDARRSLYAAQQREISTRLAQLSNFVNLYAALGGGNKTQDVDIPQ